MTRFALAFTAPALLAMSLAGCGGSSKSGAAPAGPLPPETTEPAPTAAAQTGTCVAGATPLEPLTPEEAETKGVAAMKEMGDVFERNSADCKALAQGIRDWTRANCTMLLRFKAFAETQTEEQKAEFDAKHSEEMQAIGMKMMPAMQTCGADPDVEAAMNELPN